MDENLASAHGFQKLGFQKLGFQKLGFPKFMKRVPQDGARTLQSGSSSKWSSSKWVLVKAILKARGGRKRCSFAENDAR
jgi:hypothetical protein